MITALLLQIATAGTFDEPTRWHVSSEVELPAVMWMAANLNTEARMVAWKLDLVLDCAPGTSAKKQGQEVACTVADAQVRGAAHPGDKGLLEREILQESDDRLTGSVVTLRFVKDGSLKAVSLDGPPVIRRRQTAMKENLRLMVSRAVAGFDQPIPKRDIEAGWEKKGGWIAQLPAASGTLAGGKIVYQRVSDEGPWQIAAQGRVTLEPHSAQEWPPLGAPDVFRLEGPLHPLAWDQWQGSIGMVAWFDTELRGTATWDPKTGLQERTWSAHSEPTPSSRVALAAKGYPYVQSGTIVRLGADDEVTLGESVEFDPPGDTPSAIQTWESLGAMW